LAQVISQDNLILQRRKWKDNGQCVVFVAGCFDLLHPGHIRLLEQARSHGDILIVGVQNDAGVRQAHGSVSGVEGSLASARSPRRPITPAAERVEILAALSAVDYIVECDEFDDPPPDALVFRLAPDIIVQGASPRSGPADLADDRFARSFGSKIVRILIEPGYSTARLIERITQAGA
jgi:rfaE bifunctional protein nucleotidyltransferase chain/domain